MKMIRVMMALVFVVSLANFALATETDADTDKELMEFVQKYRQALSKKT